MRWINGWGDKDRKADIYVIKQTEPNIKGRIQVVFKRGFTVQLFYLSHMFGVYNKML